MAMIRYQPEPDFEVGQVVLHELPAIVPEAVRVVEGPSRVTALDRVDVEARMFTPLQAGIIDVVGMAAAVGPAVGGAGVAAGLGEADGTADPAGWAADAVRTPVAAYRTGAPKRVVTDFPLIAVTVNHRDPDL